MYNEKIKNLPEKSKKQIIPTINILSQFITYYAPDGIKPRINVEYDKDYENIILAIADSETPTIYNKHSNIYACFKYFYNIFVEKELSYSYQFYKKLAKTEYVDVNISTQSSAFNVFETLNARGTKLLQIELVKNYLFHFLMPKNKYDRYSKKWNSMEEKLINCNINPDDYLYHVYKCFYDNKKIKTSNLYDNLKKQIVYKKDAELFFGHLTDLVDLYIKIINCDFDNVEIKFYFMYFKIKKIKVLNPVLLALLSKKEMGLITDKMFAKLIRGFRDFFVAYNLKRIMTNKIDNDIHQLSYDLMKEDNKNSIKTIVISYLKKDKSVYNNLHKCIEDIKYSNKKKESNIESITLIYLFEMIFHEEYSGGYQYIDNYKNWSIEHVLNDSFKDDVTNEIGNLFPIDKNTNSNKLKSKTYSLKKDIYKNSSYTWVSNFANKYDNFTEDDVINRSKELSAMFANIIKNNIDKL